MTNPRGIRAESVRSPKASRAGALYLYSTPHLQHVRGHHLLSRSGPRARTLLMMPAGAGGVS